MIAELRALARGPARRGHVGGVPLDTTRLRELLRHVPPSTVAYARPDEGDGPRLVLAWDVPGRRGGLWLRQLIRVPDPARSRPCRLIVGLSDYAVGEERRGRPRPSSCSGCSRDIRRMIAAVLSSGWVRHSPDDVIRACRDQMAEGYAEDLLG